MMVCVTILVATAVSSFAWTSADNAQHSAYDNGWTNNANGGSGFGAWTLSAAGSGNAGHFIGDPSAAGVSGMNVESFGQFANPNNDNTAYADRFMNDSGLDMEAGGTFTFDWGVNWDANNTSGGKGINFYNGGSAGTWLFTLKQTDSASILWNDANGGSGTLAANYGVNAMTLTLTLGASDASIGTITGTGRDGSEAISQALDFGGTLAPDSFRIWSENLDTGDQRQQYFDNFSVSSVPEPTTALLFIGGIAGLVYARRKRA